MNGDGQSKDVFGEEITSNTFIGYSIELGIDINNKLNLKAGVFQFWNEVGVDNITKPILKFSIDHNFN